MSTSKQRDGGKERLWRRLVRQWRRSGLTVRAFCEARGLSEASFYGWRRTLRQRDDETVAFVPVRVMPPEEVGQAGGHGVAGGLELVLSCGRVLRIGPDFAAATLRRVLALLEEGRPCC